MPSIIAERSPKASFMCLKSSERSAILELRWMYFSSIVSSWSGSSSEPMYSSLYLRILSRYSTHSVIKMCSFFSE